MYYKRRLITNFAKTEMSPSMSHIAGFRHALLIVFLSIFLNHGAAQKSTPQDVEDAVSATSGSIGIEVRAEKNNEAALIDESDSNDADIEEFHQNSAPREKRFTMTRRTGGSRRRNSRRKTTTTKTAAAKTKPSSSRSSSSWRSSSSGSSSSGSSSSGSSSSRSSSPHSSSSSSKSWKFSSSSRSSPKTSSSRGRNNHNGKYNGRYNGKYNGKKRNNLENGKHFLPEKQLLQIKWPKKGKIKEAIKENALYKTEVNKLKKIGALTQIQKDEILEAHNRYRGQLPGVRGYPISKIPRAQDMQKMVWDDELEKKAKIHAEHCLFAHDTRQERHLDNLVVGQNIAIDPSPSFWRTAVPQWYSQISECNWDLSGSSSAKNRGHSCAEYSQLVWSNSSRLGCASAWCPEVADWAGKSGGLSGNTGFSLVCNYGPEGNALRTTPYRPAASLGGSCAMCRSRCRDGLCDCGGKVCYNGGTLDPSSCSCSCHPLFAGPSCEEKACPPTEPEICGLPYPRGYPKDYCKENRKVQRECPYMCGICTGARCGGKSCANGGTLDLTTCSCKCQKIFGGDTCGELRCPKKDSWFCGKKWDKSYCRRIITASYECPYMCNVCRKR